MSQINETEVIELLTEKRNILANILTMSKNITFTGSDEDAAAYIDLVDKREVMINDIKGLEEKINGLTKGYGDFSSKSQNDISLLNDNIKSVIVQILDIEKRNKDYAVSIVSNLKGNMKSIKQRQSINTIYGDNFTSEDGYYFDKKK